LKVELMGLELGISLTASICLLTCRESSVSTQKALDIYLLTGAHK